MNVTTSHPLQIILGRLKFLEKAYEYLRDFIATDKNKPLCISAGISLFEIMHSMVLKTVSQ